MKRQLIIAGVLPIFTCFSGTVAVAQTTTPLTAPPFLNAAPEKSSVPSTTSAAATQPKPKAEPTIEAPKTPTPQAQEPVADALNNTSSKALAPSETAPEPQAYAPVTYAKERLVLLAKNPIDPALQGGALFQVDVQSAGSALNPDWFQIAGFKPNQGLLLTYSTPQIVDIEPSNIMAAYDIIAVNTFGEIILILPDVVLANLKQVITTPNVVNALLYVNAGTASALGLQVGDHLVHRMFQTRPTVIDEAGVSAAPAAATTPAPENTTAASTATATPTDEKARRRPSGNPVIVKPTAPNAPIVSRPEKPEVADVTPTQTAPNTGTQNSPTQTNSNLHQAEVVPPTASEETPAQKNFLDMILQRHHQSDTPPTTTKRP